MQDFGFYCLKLLNFLTIEWLTIDIDISNFIEEINPSIYIAD
jgi:hypothetical protein